MSAVTDFLSLTLPTVGGDQDTWGDESNANINAEDEAFRSLVEAGNYAAASGVDTITVSLSPGPKTLRDGLWVRFKAAGDNTTGPTLNVNGLGAKSIKFTDGSALAAGDLKSGVVYTVNYDGTAFTTTGIGIATTTEVAGTTSTKAITPKAAAYTSSGSQYSQGIGGAIHKWGTVSVTSGNGAGTTGDASVSFTTAFPTAIDSLQVSVSLPSGRLNQVSITPYYSASSTSGITVGAMRQGAGSDAAYTISWDAWGH